MLLKISFIIPFTLLILACGGSGSTSTSPSAVPPSTPTATVPSFTFSPVVNSDIDTEIQMAIDGNTIRGRTSNIMPINALKATFTFTGESVTVDDVAQQSGVTENDFSVPVTYRVTNADGNSLEYVVDLTVFTGLPVIQLTTDNGGAITSKDEYSTGTVSIFGDDSLADQTVAMKIRGRGNSTWGMPKKPYQMKLDDKAEFLGMENDKKWLFLAEYADKTLLRNRIAYELGYMSALKWTPDSRFAEVMLNEEYIGTYHITQKVEEGGDRVDLGDDGFLLEIDQIFRLDEDDVYFNTDAFLVNIKEPEVAEDDEQYRYISQFVNEFESVLMGDNFTNPDTGYQRYIDVDSFIDWYLISEITKNVDSRDFSSIYFHHSPGEKIKMGPLWDFDLAFGNVNYSDPEYAEGFWVKFNPWFARLFEDPAFVEQVKARFAFYENNRSDLLNKIDKYASKLAYAQAENDATWQTIGVYVWPNPIVLDSYEAEVERLKSWFNSRMDWLNLEFNTL